MLIAVSSFGEASAGSFLTTPAEAILNFPAQFRQEDLMQALNPIIFGY